jgi:thiol reductant ABC exporter CydC subunit
VIPSATHGGDRTTSKPLALLAHLLRLGAPQWRRVAEATALGLAAAAASIGLLAGSGYLVARATFRPGLGAIAGILALVEVMAFARAPLRYGERLAAHDAAFRALVHWRVWLFDQLEPLSPAGLRRWRSGDLLVRVIEDVDALQDLYLRCLAPTAIAVAASALAITVVAVILPWAGVVLGGCLLVAMVLPAMLVRAGAAAEHEEAALRGDLGADVVDLVQGAAELLAFDRAEDALVRIAATEQRLSVLSARRALRSAVASAVIVLSTGAAAGAVLALAVDAVHHHRLSLDLVAVLPLTAIAAFETVPPVAMAAQRIGALTAAGRRLVELGELSPPVSDPPHPEPVPTGAAIALREGKLRYADDLPWALDGFSFDLPAGGRVLMTGPSGAGKSSVVNVLLRFWSLETGVGSLGGVQLERLAQSDVRGSIAWVEQDARIFAGTIHHNITLGRPDAPENLVLDAVQRAQLGSWIASLPGGLETPVGEEGGQLSGGQRQRIALARALVTDARVLILDEPTAGLDDETAGALLRDVLAAAGDRSILMITHDDAAAELFDTRIVVEAGRVVNRPS